jgi:dTMP kinase
MRRRHSTGALIAFEGVEGAGKSTQLDLLRDELERRGHEVAVTREPGGTPVGERVRDVLLDPAVDLDPRAEALLFAAARAQLVEQVIRPALERGAVVLCDRYLDSSLAYAGLGRRAGRRDRIEVEGLGFHRRVRDAFRDLAAADPDRFAVVDAAAPAGQVAAAVLAATLKRLEER